MLLNKNSAWKCAIRYTCPRSNRVATYLALLDGELFTRLFLLFEPIGRVAELMDLDIGLGPHNAIFLEWKFHARRRGWAAGSGDWARLGEPLGIGMAAEFMNNLGFYAAPVQEAGAPEVEIHDLIYEDELLDADDALVVLEWMSWGKFGVSCPLQYLFYAWVNLF